MAAPELAAPGSAAGAAATPNDDAANAPNTPVDVERSKRKNTAPSPSPSASSNASSPGSCEWVEEVEPGVFMTLALDAGTGHHVLRRVRFSKRVFTDAEATSWWTENRARVLRTRGLKIVPK
jgi:hypothetical protein